MSKRRKLSLAKEAAFFIRYYGVPYGLINLALWCQEDGLAKSAIVGIGSGGVLGYRIGGPRASVAYSLIFGVSEPIMYRVERTLFPGLYSKSAEGDKDCS